jgi:hypothetical protein
VLGVEALRFTWKRLHEDPGVKPDAIPAGRWIAAPLATAAMRRRMWLHAEASYPRAVAMEDARLHAKDLLRAAAETEPPPAIPAALRRAVRSGRLPASVIAAVDSGMTYGGASQWEPAVAGWVTSQLTLPDRLSEQLRTERQSIARAAPADSAPDGTPATSRKAAGNSAADASQNTPRKPARAQVKKMSPEQLAPYVGVMLEENAALSQAQVMGELHVAIGKAREALRIAKRNRTVVAIGSR